MAKKILTAPPATYTTVCKTCCTKFSYELEDIIPNNLGAYNMVVCPNAKCNAQCKHVPSYS